MGRVISLVRAVVRPRARSMSQAVQGDHVALGRALRVELGSMRRAWAAREGERAACMELAVLGRSLTLTLRLFPQLLMVVAAAVAGLRQPLQWAPRERIKPSSGPREQMGTP